MAASLLSIIVKSDTCANLSNKVFIHKYVPEKYEIQGMYIAPQQYWMIAMDMINSGNSNDYSSSGEDNEDDRCRECGRY